MGILADNEVCTGNDGAIHEFVVIKIIFDETETVVWRKETRERTADYRIYYVMGYCCIGYTF